MNPVRTLILGSAALAAFGAAVAGPAGDPPPVPPVPARPAASPPFVPAPVFDLKPLGHDHFQIDRIVLDKKARRFTVPGHVAHVTDAPLEYLAVVTGSLKVYESLLEVDATGSEFNLACILIGLESTGGSKPQFQFDRRPASGPPVLVEVSWQDRGKTRRVGADEALLPDAERAKQPPSQFVYIGSFSFGPDQRFAADGAGALVGLVHDPNSVIEHRDGMGIGAYGSVRGNPAALPPIGAAVELTITATGPAVAPTKPAAPAAAPANDPAPSH